MSERTFWILLKEPLPLKMYRIENKVAKGTPDVHFIHKGVSGWIELKYIPEWPKRKVYCGIKQTQVLWLKEYYNQGGNCWVAVRIGREAIAVFSGDKADVLISGPTRAEFLNAVTWFKTGRMTEDDWLQLTGVLLNL